jgi:hypothetical protein
LVKSEFLAPPPLEPATSPAVPALSTEESKSLPEISHHEDTTILRYLPSNAPTFSPNPSKTVNLLVFNLKVVLETQPL